ncbi:MAG: hypothetical protein ABIK79_13180 [Chloroflexota bacterium]|nr:DUF1801 domain-containing protein [Anaerolineae bacterium]
MRSSASIVDQYLSELPDDRRQAVEAVRRTILANLPDGYEEVMNWGMITKLVSQTKKSSLVFRLNMRYVPPRSFFFPWVLIGIRLSTVLWRTMKLSTF